MTCLLLLVTAAGRQHSGFRPMFGVIKLHVLFKIGKAGFLKCMLSRFGGKRRFGVITKNGRFIPQILPHDFRDSRTASGSVPAAGEGT